MSMTVNILGYGKLGQQLCQTMTEQPHVRLNQVYNRSAINDLTPEMICYALSDLKKADLNLICCSDDAIESVAEALSKLPWISGCAFVHCSGVLSSNMLSLLKDKGAFVASWHPLRSFTAPTKQNAFHHCFCTVEGDEQACAQIQDVFKHEHAHLITILAEHKTLYHAAAVFATNYVVGLAQMSQSLFETAGIEPSTSQSMVLSLMDSSMKHLKGSSPFFNALTGPLQRGDIGSIEKHAEALDFDPILLEFYRSAARATLKVCKLESERHVEIEHFLKAGLSKS